MAEHHLHKYYTYLYKHDTHRRINNSLVENFFKEIFNYLNKLLLPSQKWD